MRAYQNTQTVAEQLRIVLGQFGLVHKDGRLITERVIAAARAAEEGSESDGPD